MNNIIDLVVYHGNDNPEHKFSEYKPSFFTTDYNYSLGYGKHVKAYRLNCKKVFDPSSNEADLTYYNNVFLKDSLGENAKKLEKGQHISFVDADNFWAFLSVEEEMGNGNGYDSFFVKEGSGESYQTDVSIVPLNPNNVKKLNTVDFELIPQKPILNEEDADKLFELMGIHTHGYCHALSILLAKAGLGSLKTITQKDSPEIIHSFVLSDNGMSVDGGGILSVHEMLERYLPCVTDMDISNFIVQDIKAEDLLKKSDINKDDLLQAKEFWDLSCIDYGKEIADSLSMTIEDVKVKDKTIESIFSPKSKRRNKRKL